jgi:hypothetical protein
VENSNSLVVKAVAFSGEVIECDLSLVRCYADLSLVRCYAGSSAGMNLQRFSGLFNIDLLFFKSSEYFI